MKDFSVDGPAADLAFIRGIRYVEKAKDSCETRVEITKGGVGQKFAQVKMTTARGCGLNSEITFFVDRPQLFTQEVKHY